jgi:hypothetical protein
MNENNYVPKTKTPRDEAGWNESNGFSSLVYAATSALALRRRLKYAPTAPAANAVPVRIMVPGSGTAA